MLGSIPEGKLSYKTDEKSRTAGEIAWHTAVSEKQFLDGILASAFNFENEPAMPAATNGQPIAAWYSENVPPLIEKLKAMDGATLAKPVEFFGMVFPLVTYVNFMLIHTIHHRGQLAASLRVMGGKVPSIYGGSADEPFIPGEPS